MLRTDHIYPRTMMMPLEPSRPRDSDMGELSPLVFSPQPPPIVEPLAPSRPTSFTDPAAYNAWAQRQSCAHCGASFRDRPRGADGLPIEVWNTENDCGCRNPEAKRKATAEWLWRDMMRARANATIHKDYETPWATGAATRVQADQAEYNAALRTALDAKPQPPSRVPWLGLVVSVALFAVGYLMGRWLP